MNFGSKAFVCIGLGYGDEGKGSIVDYLVRKHDANMVVRFNGGPQAAHNVVLEDGTHHTFATFGSGTFHNRCRTHLGPAFLFDPLAAQNEAKVLKTKGVEDAMTLLGVDARCRVITPYHVALNRLREHARGHRRRHGSCGMGIGETAAQFASQKPCMLTAADLRFPSRTTTKFREIRDYAQRELRSIDPQRRLADVSEPVAGLVALIENNAETTRLANMYCEAVDGNLIIREPETHLSAAKEYIGNMVFEGAQGVLLDERYGWHPHTTWSMTTTTHANQMLEQMSFTGKIERIGVTRTYMTRHGAGPFATEFIPGIGTASHAQRLCEGEHNKFNEYQSLFRYGYTDLVMLHYALDVCGDIDTLAITCEDKTLQLPSWRVCNQYRSSVGDFRWDRLPVCQSPDLGWQTYMGDMLEKFRPQYEEIDPQQLIARIADAVSLEVRVGYISSGPTAKDKRECLSVNDYAPYRANAASDKRQEFDTKYPVAANAEKA